MYSRYHLPTNTLYLTGEVCEAMTAELYSHLGKLVARGNPTIVLNTQGGDFYQALAMYDIIKFQHDDFTIVGSGNVMSAGMIILQAAKYRVTFENTQFMIHYGEDSNMSADSAKHNARMFQLMKDIVGSRANVKSRTLNSWFKADTFFNAKEAIARGLVDRMAGS